MTRKVKEMCSALAAKGFRADNTHHKAFWLYVDGKKTSIRTFFSHGSNEYGAHLLAKVRKQMKLSSNKEFDEFMDCKMDEKAYVKRMKDRKFVIDVPKSTPPSARTSHKNDN